MYYHILIQTNKNYGSSPFGMSIAVFGIKNDVEPLDIVMQYLRGDEFSADGYNLRKADILRFKIITTDRPIKELVKIENDNLDKEGMTFHLCPIDILNSDKYITDVTVQVMDKAKFFMLQSEDKTEHKISKVKPSNEVFIVHGHDNEAKTEVARFIEQLKLIPIILNEKPDSGRTIIEKIEKHSLVGYAIILYTPCDMACDKEHQDTKVFRARQNVVFEHGYFIACIGRDRVCALVKNKVETPSDINGILYTEMDSLGAWKLRLVKELNASGYDVSMDDIA